jgi:hypothetical protein
VDANVQQGEFNHNMRQRFRVTCDGENFFVCHRVRVVAKQFTAPRNRNWFWLWFRTIEYVHGASP